ncbi:MAG: PAS domain S-box protein, partial [Desulfobacterales bacterium]
MDMPSAEHTRIILDSIGDGVFTVDLNRVITFFNRAAEKITGVKRSEAVGRHCWEIFKTGTCKQGCSVH